MRAPIGMRIRHRRKAVGLSQTALAQSVGISPSYLNLIESNKREVGGALLIRIAERLGLAIDRLSGESELRLIQTVEELLLDPALEGVGLEAGDGRKLVAQFPEAATALARLYRAYSDAMASVDSYADRLKSDPLFAQLLHQVLNRITAMRSGAEILSEPDLDDDDKAHFLAAINKEAFDLTEMARTLVSYFDQSVAQQRSVSPRRELDDFIIEENNYFPILEATADSLRAEIGGDGAMTEACLAEALERNFSVTCQVASAPILQGGFSARFDFDAEHRVLRFQNSTPAATRQFQMARLYAELAAADVLDTHVNDRRLTSPAARRLAYRAMASYLAGAIMMPYGRILEDAERQHYDIDVLSHQYTASFEQVAHRFVTLRRRGEEGVPFGFLRADPAGRLTKHFPLPGLLLPSSGHGCPLWPIYEAIRTDRIVRQVAEFSNGSRYLFIASAVSKRAGAYREQPFHYSVMLACDILHADRTIYGRGLNLGEPLITVPVGPSCRLCVRRQCGHRQEDALDTGSENPHLHEPMIRREFRIDQTV
ncbi:helix-turn-helix domain-containing protein [Pseudaminobacter sp. NGMCC 1.201702]|uniref:helix-turn-helix domain-containing protein n=1 Tax=Pseudaminobacter sp. NGMCC 1.201702 TaxID=3391825 RepID=UPI0039F10F12